MSRPLYNWIKASLDGKAERKNGSVIACDFDYKPMSELAFSSAILTEFGMPALDASAKDPAYMALKFQPESTRRRPVAAACPASTGKQKMFFPGNFRIVIDGIDATRVSKIDAFTIKQGIVSGDVGGGRTAQIEPAKLEFPNLVITLQAASAQTWQAWYEDFAIKGNNGDDREKSGVIELLGEGKTVLARLRLSNLGIVRLAPVPEPGVEKATPSQITAELYVERIQLEVPAFD